jgi:hypothetical protein
MRIWISILSVCFGLINLITPSIAYANSKESLEKTIDLPAAASVDGRYSNLIQILPCTTDQATYGKFNDYGYWGGGAWCGQVGRAGYWVWVAPNWYVWKNQNK